MHSLKRIIISILILASPFAAFSQKQKQKAATEGLLYFSLTAAKNGKEVVIIKDNGKTILLDSLKMAEKITAYYKVGQKITNVKDIAYDNYFLSNANDPTILLDMHGVAFDTSIWHSCIDSLHNKEQVVFEIREITLEDGSKIQNPKLAKESMADYHVYTSPDFPPGGWQAKANHWIDMWRQWFRLRDKDVSFYKLNDKELDLSAAGIVYTVYKPPVKPHGK